MWVSISQSVYVRAFSVWHDYGHCGEQVAVALAEAKTTANTGQDMLCSLIPLGAGVIGLLLSGTRQHLKSLIYRHCASGRRTGLARASSVLYIS